MSNPLLSPSDLPFGLPDYTTLTDADFREALETGMVEQLQELDAVAAEKSPATVENVLAAWERTGATLTRALYAFWVAKAADTNDERDAIEADLAPKFAAHTDAILLNRGLYDRLSALAARRDADEVDLDEQDAYLLERLLLDYERGGIHLDDQAQQRLRELNGEIAALSTKFDQLLVAGRNAAGVHVTDEAELVGLGEDELARLADAARRADLDGWLIDITNTSGQPILASLDDRSLRERVYRASTERGLGGEFDTRETLLDLTRLRDARARLLGYPHHAAYVAEDSVAKSTDTVNEMLARLAAGAVRNAEREAAELAARFAQIEPGATFSAWDWQYVAEKVRGERFTLDSAALRPYLEFSNVLEKGVFAAATSLYGITFKLLPDLVGYVPDARVYEVLAQDGSILGAVLIDPFTRPTKQGGAWMTSIVDQSDLLDARPVVTNTCNFSVPAPGKPSLLSWDNVITLFHEFGHDLHGLLSDVRYPSRSGTAVPRDFVEYPSQVNEIWAWHPALLESYAVHHETGEPLPREWIDTLLAARSFGDGYAKTESLKAMLLDQAWHQAAADDLPVSGFGVEAFEERALQQAGVAFPLVPPRYRSTYFHHIFGGGYSAGYDSYIWSEIMDADTVAWFQEHDNGGLNREAGEAFRRGLLGRGGSIDPMEAYLRFRGADPELQHRLNRMGVA